MLVHPSCNTDRLRAEQESVLRKIRRRSGAVAAEFAVIAPFLVFLILGTFEIARGIMIKQMLNDAARKACRTGIKPGTASSAIIQEVNNILSDNNIPTSDATITILVNDVSADASTAQRNDKVTVSVAIPITDVYWISTFFLTKSYVDSDYISMMRQ